MHLPLIPIKTKTKKETKQKCIKRKKKTKRKSNQIQQNIQLTATNDQKQISGVYNFAPLSLVSLYIYVHSYIYK